MRNFHDPTTGGDKSPAIYAGVIGVTAIVALILIRITLEHK